MSSAKSARDASGAQPTVRDDLSSLLDQSAGGDEVAFAALYDATAARAYGLCLCVLHDSDQAAEVMREAYLHLWAHAARFQPTQGSAIAWILVVVHRRAVDRMRSRASVAGREPAVDLSSTPRHVVGLAYCQGLTHREIELSGGLPAGTVQVQLRDELVELRDANGGASSSS